MNEINSIINIKKNDRAAKVMLSCLTSLFKRIH